MLISLSQAKLLKDPYSFKLDGKNIIITHHPDIIDALAEKYEIVIYGHTHKPDNRRNKALIINPGECCGWLSGRKTVGILELEEMKAEIINL